MAHFGIPQDRANSPLKMQSNRNELCPILIPISGPHCGAHIPIMDELQVFHDQSRSTSLSPLNGLDRETSHQRGRVGWIGHRRDGGPDRLSPRVP